MNRIKDKQQKYKTDGDRLRLLAEALEDESLTDGAFRCLVRAILFPSRVDDRAYKWALDRVKELGLD